MNERTIAAMVVMALAIIALVILSLALAEAQGALNRVTRSSLNNLILGLQTDQELSQFSRMKRIDRIHRAQNLISQRQVTGSACAFFRIICDIMVGVLVACMAALGGMPLWEQLLCGVVMAILVAAISVTLGPRGRSRQPMEALLKHVRLVGMAVLLTP
ncbi:MAG: HlyC/CorC family transporter, partial [Bifidobacterium sp.]|nr:HlyC/CorC family transporter [Bifidobacterium sp.]